MSWLETRPLTVIALAIMAALVAAATIGYRGHLWLLHRSGETEPESHDHLLSAVLGLLALLLGFTFSLALNRYEARRDLVVQEANAIGTAWLRAQLLEPPNKAAMSGLLRSCGAGSVGADGGAAAEIVDRHRPGPAFGAQSATLARTDGCGEPELRPGLGANRGAIGACA